MLPQAKNLLLRSSNPFLALCGDSQLLFKLIYLWKAHNNSKGDIILGLEMLMIDEEISVLMFIDKQTARSAVKSLDPAKSICLRLFKSRFFREAKITGFRLSVELGSFFCGKRWNELETCWRPKPYSLPLDRKLQTI
ncbi:hypothetical protein YC2023_110736 [Brassica napus]